jgi:hypothetical protein
VRPFTPPRQDHPQVLIIAHASGTTSTNWYGGNLGLWGGRSTTTQSGTSGFQAGYYSNTGTVKYTNWP